MSTRTVAINDIESFIPQETYLVSVATDGRREHASERVTVSSQLGKASTVRIADVDFAGAGQIATAGWWRLADKNDLCATKVC